MQLPTLDVVRLLDRPDRIYVATVIRASMDDVFATTQTPELHQRWDLRFGEIRPLSAPVGQPARFAYGTTVLPGVTVFGEGRSLSSRGHPDGSRWSGLRFRCDDRRSVLAAGSGYWRYEPVEGGVRFSTGFDYRPRWGRAGALVDRVVFRPAFGRATAWSFDRLRIWLEDGTTPEAARNRTVVHAAATAVAVASALAGAAATALPLDAGGGRRSIRVPALAAVVAAGGLVARTATASGRPSAARCERRPADRAAVRAAIDDVERRL